MAGLEDKEKLKLEAEIIVTMDSASIKKKIDEIQKYLDSKTKANQDKYLKSLKKLAEDELSLKRKRKD